MEISYEIQGVNRHTGIKTTTSIPRQCFHLVNYIWRVEWDNGDIHAEAKVHAVWAEDEMSALTEALRRLEWAKVRREGMGNWKEMKHENKAKELGGKKRQD